MDSNSLPEVERLVSSVVLLVHVCTMYVRYVYVVFVCTYFVSFTTFPYDVFTSVHVSLVHFVTSDFCSSGWLAALMMATLFFWQTQQRSFMGLVTMM